MTDTESKFGSPQRPATRANDAGRGAPSLGSHISAEPGFVSAQARSLRQVINYRPLNFKSTSFNIIRRLTFLRSLAVTASLIGSFGLFKFGERTLPARPNFGMKLVLSGGVLSPARVNISIKHAKGLLTAFGRVRRARTLKIVSPGFAIGTTVGAEMQLEQTMRGHGVRFVHTKAMERIVLERISTIFHGFSMQGNLRQATLTPQATHVQHCFKISLIPVKVNLKSAFDALKIGVEGMPSFLGHLTNHIKLSDLGLRVSKGTNGVKLITIGQVPQHSDEATQDTGRQAGGFR